MPGKSINILGISAYYHDSAACLVQDGAIIAAAQEERFTRKKHDERFPRNAVDYCLREGGITTADLDYVAFYEKPFTEVRPDPSFISGLRADRHSLVSQSDSDLGQRKDLDEGELQKELNFDGTIIFPEHHESHAASAFFPSPFQEAAFLTVDGVGEWTTTSYGIGRGQSRRDSRRTALSAFARVALLAPSLTSRVSGSIRGEYKLMGLAPYGEPKYTDVILRELIDLKEDGSFRLNMKYFNYCVGLTMTNEKFDALFGRPPRKPESKLTQRDMDLARSIQDVTEEIIFAWPHTYSSRRA